MTVVASDGGMTDDRMVTVKVTDNADERGMVELSSQDALIGVPITATLKDSDGGVPDPATLTGVTWTWERDNDTNPDNTNTADQDDIEDEESDTYTPTTDDKGMYLRATAMYTDRTRDATNLFMNTAVSDPTTAVRNNPDNQAPEFKDARTFRVVEENTMALTDADDDDAADDEPADNVGQPVEAEDDDGDMLTYTLSGADADMFRVRSNGQIEVAKKAELNYETDTSHTVTLTATDSSGASNNTATIRVTIYITDVDEAPEIMKVPTENQAPVFRSSSTTRSIPEGQSSGRPIGAVVTAIDPGDSLTYILEGTDAASFSIDGGTGQLRTSASLDHNTKSTYRVIVKATDRDGLSDTITVTITVTEAEEQMGEVTLWAGAVRLTMAPQVGDRIMGAVMDPDGGVTGESWRWSRSMDTADKSSWMPITGATDAAYTVTQDDADHYLRVMATYTDAVGTDMDMVYSMPTMMVGAMAADPLLDEYDPNGDGAIVRVDMLRAVGKFFAEPPELTRAEMLRLVIIFFQ